MNWKDISLRQGIELMKIEEEDKLEMILQQYSIIKNISIEDVENMTPADILKESNSWTFINELPSPKLTKKIKVNGRKYKIIDLSKMKLAQLIDIETYYGMGLIDNIHNILSIIYLEDKWFKDVDYEFDEDRANDMLDVDMETMWGTLLFFWTTEKVYLRGLVDCLNQEDQKKMMEMMNQQMEGEQ